LLGWDHARFRRSAGHPRLRPISSQPRPKLSQGCPIATSQSIQMPSLSVPVFLVTSPGRWFGQWRFANTSCQDCQPHQFWIVWRFWQSTLCYFQVNLRRGAPYFFTAFDENMAVSRF
jgi:hypothetical protein